MCEETEENEDHEGSTSCERVRETGIWTPFTTTNFSLSLPFLVGGMGKEEEVEGGGVHADMRGGGSEGGDDKGVLKAEDREVDVEVEKDNGVEDSDGIPGEAGE